MVKLAFASLALFKSDVTVSEIVKCKLKLYYGNSYS